MAREIRGPWSDSCVLDVADEGGATLERVGAVFGFTRERTRQIEMQALFKMKHRRPFLLTILEDK